MANSLTLPPKSQPLAEKCNHTLSRTNPAGTWHAVSAGKAGRKVICKVCGRFYGYLAYEPPPPTLLTPGQEANLKRILEKSAAMLLEMQEARP